MHAGQTVACKKDLADEAHFYLFCCHTLFYNAD